MMTFENLITGFNTNQQKRPASSSSASSESSNLMTMMMLAAASTTTTTTTEDRRRKRQKVVCSCSSCGETTTHRSVKQPKQQRHRVVKRIDLARRRQLTATVTTSTLATTTTNTKRSKRRRPSETVSSASSSSGSGSGSHEMRRQFGHSLLSSSTPSSRIAQFSNHHQHQSNKYFNSTCSSCLTINCDCCYKKFPFNELVNSRLIQNVKSCEAESKPVSREKRKTPFETTFSEFLSSTPIIRGASTSTRRVRSIFANRSTTTHTTKVATQSTTTTTTRVAKPKTASRLNKIVRTATNLFSGVSSTTVATANLVNYQAPAVYTATASVHNTTDNFKNFGDFLVWYV